jgi:LPS-assembly protein
LYSNIDFQSTSDEYFFRDIGNDQFGETRTSYLPRKFSLTWKNPFLKINLGISRYQILNPFSFEEYKSKPNLNIQTYLSRNNLSFSIFANKSKFELDHVNPLRSSYEEVDRLFVSPKITFRKNLPSSTFLFSTGTTYIKHNFDSLQESKSSPWVEMKYSVFLDKVNNLQVSSLIPVIKYVFVEDSYKNQTNLIDSRIISLDYSTIFQRGRFVGLDRFSENNKIIVGLERVSSSLDKDSFNSVSLGKAFYLKDRTYYEDSSIIRDSSPLVAEFKTKLRGNIWSKSLFEWDNKSKKLNLASFGFSYQKNDLKRIEFRSIYRRQDPNKTYIPWFDKDKKTNHSELVTQWPLSKSINLFARWQKDHESNKSNDILFGFEYSNCCLKWGLMNRKWIEEDYFSWKNNYSSSFQALSQGLDPSIERSRTYVFFELKNIGRLGKEISKALSSTKLE